MMVHAAAAGSASPPSYSEQAPPYESIEKLSAAPPPALGPALGPDAGARPTYTRVSANEHACYLTRSDGTVDRTARGGNVTSQIRPAPGRSFTAAAAGHVATYYLRSDGVAVRATLFGRAAPGDVSAEVRPPPGVVYTMLSAGPFCSLFLRSDGAVEAVRGGAVSEVVTAPAGLRYTDVTAGVSAAYFLRTDGVVERARSGWGGYKLAARAELWPAPEKAAGGAGAPTVYTALGTQLACSHDKGIHGNWATYLVRSDGRVDRLTAWGRVAQTIEPPEGDAYVAASSGEHASYLLTAQGKVARTVTGGTVGAVIAPPDGARFVGVAAGRTASYLLLDTGVVLRTTGHGRISKEMRAPVAGEGAEPLASGCTIA